MLFPDEVTNEQVAQAFGDCVSGMVKDKKVGVSPAKLLADAVSREDLVVVFFSRSLRRAIIGSTLAQIRACKNNAALNRLVKRRVEGGLEDLAFALTMPRTTKV